MIRELARKLATFNQLVDFVIIEIFFRRGTFEATAEILKSHSSMVLLRVCLSDAELLIKMIRPRREIRVALGCRIQSAEKFWRVFTSLEVLTFVEAVGDKNPIHKLNPPIVPALLILEKICAEFSFDCVKLKFKHFITAGESLSLQASDNQLEISSAGVRKVLGELS